MPPTPDTTDPAGPKTRIITLTAHPPIRIVEADWLTIAWTSVPTTGRHATLRVREHRDGRRIVYGKFVTRWQGERDVAAGEVVPPTSDQGATIAAIQRVAAALAFQIEALAQGCIASLPAEDL